MIPTRELFPLSENGSVVVAVEHEPGPVRPFAARLAAPVVPQAGKHDRQPTRSNYQTRSNTSMDGKQQADFHTDTQND